MAVIDRHRVSQLITLTALEQTLQGPERLLREEDVAILIKAAYDDATAAARAAFMERVKDYPESKWPWSAVEVAKPPQGKGGGGIVIVAVPSGPKTPAALILILGQADSPDADPGNRLPERTSAEGAEWEPLYKAFDTWSVSTIQKYISPGGWMTPGGKVPFEEPQDGDTSGAPPNDGGKGPDQGSGQNGNDNGNGNGNGQDAPIATQPAEPGVPRWVWGLAIAGGTALVVGTGVYLLRKPAPRTLEQELLRQQGGGGR